MADNVLDLEPKKIQALSGGVQSPTIKVSNTDISQSVNNLADTIMSIGGSIIKNNRIKEAEERKDLLKQEKENMENYNKIFKIQSKEMMNAGYAKMSSEMENFYDTPSVFDSALDSNYDNYYKSIVDNKGLTELSKAELQVENEKWKRTVKEKFRTGVNKYNIQHNKDGVDKIVSEAINNIPNYVYDGDIESAQESLVDLTDGMKLGMKINPDEYTPENIAQTLGVVTSRYLESLVGGTINKYKDDHDLNTTEGVNNFIEQLVAYSKNFDSENMRNFFTETFKGLPFEHENVDAKVHGMIKKQVEQEMWLAKNKKKEIKKRTLAEKQQDQLHPHNPLQREGLIYDGKGSNKGHRAIVVGTKTGINFNSDIEAGIYAEENDIIYSLHSRNEMKILKDKLDPLLEVNDSEGVLEILNESHDFKLLDEDGNIALPYDEEMYYLDIKEATGGLIDGNYFEAYRKGDEKVIDAYVLSLRFGNNNDLVGDDDFMLEELGGGGSFFGKGLRFALEETLSLPFRGATEYEEVEDNPMRIANEKMIYMSTNNKDIEEPERLRTLINNAAYSYFYKSMLPDEDEMAKYNSEDDKGKKKMIKKFYKKKKNIEKLREVSETLSENFLGGNIVDISSGGMPSKILVSDEFKDLDFNGIKSDIIENGNLFFVEPSTNETYEISSTKLKDNLVIEDVGEDRVGFFYKDKKHQLKFMENGVLKDAETDLDKIETFDKTLEQSDMFKEDVTLTSYEDFAKGRNLVASIGDDKMYKVVAINEGTYGNKKVATTLSFAGGKSGLSFGYQQYDTRTNKGSYKILKDLGVTGKEMSAIKKFNKNASHSELKKFKKTEIFKSIERKLIKGERALYNLAKEDFTNSVKFFDKLGFNENTVSTQVLASMVDLKNQFGFSRNGMFSKYFKKIINEGREITMEDVLKLRMGTRQGQQQPKDQERRHNNILNVYR